VVDTGTSLAQTAANIHILVQSLRSPLAQRDK
jgi:hypothetical protein